MSSESSIDFDTTDVDRWIGVPLGGGNMKDPVHVNDIRRWAQAMQNPNPLYYDDEYASAGRLGRLVAPQSFAVCCSDSHGAAPSIQGRIDGTHMLFGGDEWWFDGPRIEPGDEVHQERVLVDYTVKQTKFAGPTMFSRGDTRYINQRGELVAKQRCTSIRYRADEARKRAEGTEQPAAPEWTDEQLEQVEARKREYFQSFLQLGHEPRRGVTAGDVLATRVIGPHSIQSFTTEWRSFPMNTWGAFGHDGGKTSLRQAGWLPEMDKDMEAAKVDPSQADGLYRGASRGHTQDRYAKLIGMPRSYGYGASMGAWILDYLGNWIGEWGEIVHSKMAYRSPAFTDDVTYIDGTVASVEAGVAAVEIAMTNQDKKVLAKGTAEVKLPDEGK